MDLCFHQMVHIFCFCHKYICNTYETKLSCLTCNALDNYFISPRLLVIHFMQWFELCYRYENYNNTLL